MLSVISTVCFVQTYGWILSIVHSSSLVDISPFWGSMSYILLLRHVLNQIILGTLHVPLSILKNTIWPPRWPPKYNSSHILLSKADRKMIFASKGMFSGSMNPMEHISCRYSNLLWVKSKKTAKMATKIQK